MKSELFNSFVLRVLAGLVIVLCFALVLLKIDAAGESDTEKTRSAYYHELENRYKQVVKYNLENNGLRNAGINITAVINADGSRAYLVEIHHEKYESFDEIKKQEILTSLAAINFADNESPVSVVFF